MAKNKIVAEVHPPIFSLYFSGGGFGGAVEGEGVQLCFGACGGHVHVAVDGARYISGADDALVEVDPQAAGAAEAAHRRSGERDDEGLLDLAAQLALQPREKRTGAEVARAARSGKRVSSRKTVKSA